MPLAAALNGAAPATETDADKDKSADKEVTLPTVEVKDMAKQRETGYLAAKTDTPLLETPQLISVVTSVQMEA